MKKNMQSKQKFIPKRYVLIGSILTTTIIFISIIVFLLMQLNKPINISSMNPKKDSRPTVISKDNVNEYFNYTGEPIPDGSYEIIMNTNWFFGGNKSNAYIENSTSNTRTVYFDVFLSDTKQLVYSSPYIPVGENFQEFDLDVDLAPGNYTGYLTYYLVDDNHDYISDLSVNVTFQVD